MSDDLPYVIQPPQDAALASAAAAVAAAKWGLPAPEHLRTGMNTLFVAGDEVVLRVSRPTAPASQAVWLMGALARLGVRVPRQLRAEPFEAHGLTVFAVERLHPVGDVDWREVGAMVRRVHDWPTFEVRGRYPLPKADAFPWWNVPAALAEVDDLLDERARAGLHAAIAAHGDWRECVTARVVCHGDVHPGNVLQTAEGAVLLDWDLLCHAPAAWDHSTVLTWPRRWGGVPTMYERFADGYGRSLEGDPLTESLATMRNVVATLMRVRVGRTNPAAAEEAERRLRYWRNEPDAPMWNAQ
ncbi:MAG: aminoglycoside phosphotransferase family protein [Ilumatobacteraceae bacterium]